MFGPIYFHIPQPGINLTFCLTRCQQKTSHYWNIIPSCKIFKHRLLQQSKFEQPVSTAKLAKFKKLFYFVKVMKPQNAKKVRNKCNLYNSGLHFRVPIPCYRPGCVGRVPTRLRWGEIRHSLLEETSVQTPGTDPVVLNYHIRQKNVQPRWRVEEKDRISLLRGKICFFMLTALRPSFRFPCNVIWN